MKTFLGSGVLVVSVAIVAIGCGMTGAERAVTVPGDGPIGVVDGGDTPDISGTDAFFEDRPVVNGSDPSDVGDAEITDLGIHAPDEGTQDGSADVSESDVGDASDGGTQVPDTGPADGSADVSAPDGGNVVDTGYSGDASSFVRTYGGGNNELLGDVKQTPEGGYIAVGETHTFGTDDELFSDFLMVKLDALGNVEWQKTIGREHQDDAWFVRLTPDGGFLVAGRTSPDEPGYHNSPWLVRVSSAGAVEWQKTYAWQEAEIKGIKNTSEGGHIMGGYVSIRERPDLDAMIVKLSSTGEVEWQKTFGGVDTDVALAVHQRPSGGFLITGKSYSFSPADECNGDPCLHLWLVAFSPQGNIEWQELLRLGRWDIGLAIADAGDGGYVIGALTQSFPPIEWRHWLVKIDDRGSIEWQKAIPGARLSGARAGGYSLLRHPSGGYVLAADSGPVGDHAECGGTPCNHIRVLRLTDEGDPVWSRVLGGDSVDQAGALGLTDDDGFIVGASTKFGVGGADFWVLKLRPDGSVAEDCGALVGDPVSVEATDTDATITDTDAVATEAEFVAMETEAPTSDADVISQSTCAMTSDNSSWSSMTLGGAGWDSAYDAKITSDGGYLVVGVSESFGSGSCGFESECQQAWIVKLTADGKIVWQKVFGGSDFDAAFSIDEAIDGSYFVAADLTPADAGPGRAVLFKFRDDGSIIWQKSVGVGAFGYLGKVIHTRDGGCVALGAFGSANVVKLSAAGEVEWAKSFPAPSGFGAIVDVLQMSDGTYILAGEDGVLGQNETNCRVVKLDAQGLPLWQRVYKGVASYSVEMAAEAGENDFVVAGFDSRFGSVPSNRGWAMKLSADGNVVWQNSLGGTGEHSFSSVAASSDGGFIFGGKNLVDKANDCWVAKLGANGKAEWQKTYGGFEDEETARVFQNPSGEIVLAGRTKSFGSGYADFWLLRMKPDGSIGSGCVSSVGLSHDAAETTGPVTVLDVPAEATEGVVAITDALWEGKDTLDVPHVQCRVR